VPKEELLSVRGVAWGPGWGARSRLPCYGSGAGAGGLVRGQGAAHGAGGQGQTKGRGVRNRGRAGDHGKGALCAFTCDEAPFTTVSTESKLSGLLLDLSRSDLFREQSLRLTIPSAGFFDSLSLRLHRFLQRHLRSTAYLNGIREGAGGGLWMRLNWFRTRRLCNGRDWNGVWAWRVGLDCCGTDHLRGLPASTMLSAETRETVRARMRLTWLEIGSWARGARRVGARGAGLGAGVDHSSGRSQSTPDISRKTFPFQRSIL
jgi:hypothetical protein